MDGDTVVDGLLYHKLWYYELDASQNAPLGMTFGLILGATVSKGYHGAFRNDSINKKVFYLRRSLNQEQLLYDFNLSLGDTLQSNSIKFLLILVINLL
ncbi:hypothetical protein N9B55_00060 [Vicingaceae bacterium]|nr:hypothetical protein [Vicingaceae bacterium]